MAHRISITELRRMPVADLLKEASSQRDVVEKMRLGIAMNKEKNTGKYQQERKQLARMETIATEKRAESLPTEEKTRTVSARTKGGSRRSSTKS